MAKSLLLVPTESERDGLLSAIAKASSTDALSKSWDVELCGFGVIAAAAMTMRWLHRHQPERVVLAGISGAYRKSTPLGSALWFSEVHCDGIGVGGQFSDVFISAAELGWAQVSAISSVDNDGEEFTGAIGDRLSLQLPAMAANSGEDHVSKDSMLLTVCAASASPAMAQDRVNRYDGAPVAEDMEGFSVAMACHVHGVPLSIVRGISNRAGDRDHSRWQVEAALGSVAKQFVAKEIVA